MGSDDVLLFLTSNADNIKIDDLLDTLSNFESVNRVLQLEGTTIEDSRVMFDAVVEIAPELRERLRPPAPIVLQLLFESTIVKLQESRIAELSVMEKNAVACFRKDEIPRDDVTPTDSFAADALKRRCLGISTSEAGYLDSPFILATSIICERLMSLFGMEFRYHRDRILPAHIEQQVF